MKEKERREIPRVLCDLIFFIYSLFIYFKCGSFVSNDNDNNDHDNYDNARRGDEMGGWEAVGFLWELERQKRRKRGREKT